MRLIQISRVAKSCLLALTLALAIAGTSTQIEPQNGKSGHETHGKSVETG